MAKRRLLLPSLVLAGSLFAHSAYAACASSGDVLDAKTSILLQISMTEKSIVGRIGTMETAIVRTLEKSTAQLSLYIKQHGTLMAKIADGQQKNAAELARDTLEVEIARGLAPQRTYCESVSGLAGLSATEEISATLLQNSMANRVNRLAQNTQEGAIGRATSLRYRWAQLKEYQPKECKNNETLKVIDGEETCVVNADINPALLFGIQTLDNDGLRKTSQAFIDNLISAVEEDPLVYENMETTADKLKYLEQRKKFSRLALAYYVLLQIRSNKMEAVKLGNWANAILPEGLGRGENLSKDDLYKVLASDRFRQPNYFTSLQGLTPENKKLEMLTNQAVSLMLQNEQYQQGQVTNSLLASMLAQLMQKNETSPKLMTSTAVEN